MFDSTKHNAEFPDYYDKKFLETRYEHELLSRMPKDKSDMTWMDKKGQDTRAFLCKYMNDLIFSKQEPQPDLCVTACSQATCMSRRSALVALGESTEPSHTPCLPAFCRWALSLALSLCVPVPVCPCPRKFSYVCGFVGRKGMKHDADGLPCGGSVMLNMYRNLHLPTIIIKVSPFPL